MKCIFVYLNSAVIIMMVSVVNYWISVIILVEINVLVFGYNILDNQLKEVEDTNTKNDNGLISYF